ncbi:hypothetical protein HPP92_015223 [Vanilla planifolia]|uniref:DYW domain-containing protein n=2 Tax=Vanilla planifolia TaxID=51239 RepID=A0A835UVL5_VANPL|nr:hypothetical protein HPP92_015223 [Vanilla planifolia]
MKAPNMTVRAHSSSILKDLSLKTHPLFTAPSHSSLLPSTKLLKQTHAKLLRNGEIHDSLTAGKLIADVATSHYSNLPYAFRLLSHPHFPLNTFAWNSLIRGFAEGPIPENSVYVYRRMLAGGFAPNNYTYTFLLKASAFLAEPRLGLSLHANIISRGLDGLDPYIQTSLISFYAALVSVDTAQQLFDESSMRDVTAWNALIKGYLASGQYMKVIRLFQVMQDRCNVCADEVTMLSVASASAHLGTLDVGKWIHTYIGKNKLIMTLNLGTALINMYAKCGDIESAIALFWKMEEKDMRTWSVMISAFSLHGLAKEAFDLFMDMQRVGIDPDSVTITALLSACSHRGMVKEGRIILCRMSTVYNIEPTIEHYGCIVDLLGRAGHLDEALDLIRKMSLKPDVVLWGSLLVACRVHRNIEMGKVVADEILELDPCNAGALVFLSNLHAAYGNWDRVQEVRDKMKEQRINKPPGSSLIELNGVIHEFLSGDKSHSQVDSIYMMLDEIGRLARRKGHKTAMDGFPFDIDDEDKEVCVSQHSEKLAVAFGLINTRPGSVIRVIKNLRICSDCHEIMKYVSEAFERTVVVRDCNRFHQFSKGSCSCVDYW